MSQTILIRGTACRLHWVKPRLNLSLFNGSRANNILWPREDSSACMGTTCPQAGASVVFEDTHPDTPASERYKSYGSDAAGHDIVLVSADGLDFAPARTAKGAARRVKGAYNVRPLFNGPDKVCAVGLSQLQFIIC